MANLQNVMQRLTEARKRLLKRQPFLGRLVYALQFGLDNKCETAYTDMKRIVFCPDFVDRLSDKEVDFLLMHEVLHCTLKHCIRGIGLNSMLYNIACDIVVNSLILSMEEIDSMQVDGCEVMHLTPNNEEGNLYTAEQVYNMLIKKVHDSDSSGKYIFIDNHGKWKSIPDAYKISAEWEEKITSTLKRCGSGGVPQLLNKQLQSTKNSKIDWKQELMEYIMHDRSDYLFSQPDRRFSDYEFILPSLCENVYGAIISKIWFLIDVSGSVSKEEYNQAYAEIQAACNQLSFKGLLSLFDTEVSDPMEFENIPDTLNIDFKGTGGTSFVAIFDKLDEHFEEDDLPALIIILTDGYSSFPPEERAKDIPVVWCLSDTHLKESDIPFGKVIFIDDKA